MHFPGIEQFNVQFERTVGGSWHPRGQDEIGLNPWVPILRQSTLLLKQRAPYEGVRPSSGIIRVSGGDTGEEGTSV